METMERKKPRPRRSFESHPRSQRRRSGYGPAPESHEGPPDGPAAPAGTAPVRPRPDDLVPTGRSRQ